MIQCKDLMDEIDRYNKKVVEDARKLTNQARAAHLANLERLTTEARIRRIEEWIYDYKPSINPMNERRLI